MQDTSGYDNRPAVQEQGQIALGVSTRHQPWYREGKLLIALVTTILGTSGIAGIVQFILEDHRKTAELEIARTNNEAHLKLEQDKQAHEIARAREQQRHSIAEQYLQRVTDPRATSDNVETVYELIVRIEGEEDTRGVSSWAKQQLNRLRQRRDAVLKAQELQKEAAALTASRAQALPAQGGPDEGAGVITADAKLLEKKYDTQSAALGLKLIETQKRLADLERQLGIAREAPGRVESASAVVSPRITLEVLVALGAFESAAQRYVSDLNALTERYGINTELRRAHFLAQVMHESGNLQRTQENVNYSWQALRQTWPSRFSTDEIAQGYHRQPVKIANHVYANRMGNGPEETGNGWQFLGRGLLLLTGKANYERFAEWINNREVLSQPELMASRYECTLPYSSGSRWTLIDSLMRMT